MRPEIIFDDFFVVDTVNSGIFIPSGVLFPIPFANAKEMHEEKLSKLLAPFVDSKIREIGFKENVFGSRLSSPGFLDSTEWDIFDCKQEAEDHLYKTYQWPQCMHCFSLFSEKDVEDYRSVNNNSDPEECEKCKILLPRLRSDKYEEVARITYLMPYGPESINFFILAMWDANRRDDSGRLGIAYRLDNCVLFKNTPNSFHHQCLEHIFDSHKTGKIVFTHAAVDSIEAIRAVLTHCTLHPGALDPEDYTSSQLYFVRNHAEAIACEGRSRFGED